MMRRREQAAGTPDLAPETVAILLRGWCADPPPDVPPRAGGVDPDFLTLYFIDGIATLWRRHEGWLREQARMWGWAPTFTLAGGTPAFYAERSAVDGIE
jgi:hypothetical protein